MTNNNKQGGFFQLIIGIIVALIIIKMLGLTVSGVFNYFVNLLRSVF